MRLVRIFFALFFYQPYAATRRKYFFSIFLLRTLSRYTAKQSRRVAAQCLLSTFYFLLSTFYFLLTTDYCLLSTVLLSYCLTVLLSHQYYVPLITIPIEPWINNPVIVGIISSTPLEGSAKRLWRINDIDLLAIVPHMPWCITRTGDAVYIIPFKV